MPEEPKDGQGEVDPDVDAELTEFEAALKREVEESKRIPHVEEPPEDPIAAAFPSSEEIEARLARAIDEAQSYIGPATHDRIRAAHEEHEEKNPPKDDEGVHAEFTDRIREADRRLVHSRARRETKEGKRRSVQESEADAARGLGMGLSAAYAIIGCPLLGAGVGFLIDRGTGSTAGVTVGTVAGAGLGMAAAIWILSRNEKK